MIPLKETRLRKRCLVFGMTVLLTCVLAGTRANAQGDDLFHAAARGDLTSVNALLAAKADVNARQSNGVTALMIASLKGHEDVVRALLAANADVNAKMETEGATALMYASYSGYPEVVRVLLAANADVNTKAKNGTTALMDASLYGHLEVVRALISAKADVNAKVLPSDNAALALAEGVTALILASQKGHQEVVQALLDAKTDPNAKANDGDTALIVGAANGHLEIVRALLKAKADVNAKDRNGDTALMRASKNDHEDVVQLLKSADAEISFGQASDSNQQARAASLPGAKDTTVRLTTQLGVTKTVSVNQIIDSDPVLSSLLGPWNMAQANFVIQTESGVYLVIPQELFRSAKTEDGKHVVRLSTGKTLLGRLVGTILEGPTATVISKPTNRYALADCLTIELLTIDGSYLWYRSDKNPDRVRNSDDQETKSQWSLFLQERTDPSFKLINPRLTYKYKWIPVNDSGGFTAHTEVKSTASFQVEVAKNKHEVNMDDFRELSFSIKEGRASVAVDSNGGVKTVGTIVIDEPDRGELFLVGELISEPSMKVAIKIVKARLHRDNP